ncbi:hypothetical protein QBC34DRAFT_181350 [Podospora aff. communis PSN243]|uniref:Uncharacterized protein n=1 Tax=Podospora aff. communis PSN243 TaxID=3040156 RepID=A0AAV9G8I9_9PEZI|nr:hypothetical protein QBC34DRAFT_181350 [Podospora aff. communis PSN243]
MICWLLRELGGAQNPFFVILPLWRFSSGAPWWFTRTWLQTGVVGCYTPHAYALGKDVMFRRRSPGKEGSLPAHRAGARDKLSTLRQAKRGRLWRQVWSLVAAILRLQRPPPSALSHSDCWGPVAFCRELLATNAAAAHRRLILQARQWLLSWPCVFLFLDCQLSGALEGSEARLNPHRRRPLVEVGPPLGRPERAPFAPVTSPSGLALVEKCSLFPPEDKTSVFRNAKASNEAGRCARHHHPAVLCVQNICAKPLGRASKVRLASPLKPNPPKS